MAVVEICRLDMNLGLAIYSTVNFLGLVSGSPGLTLAMLVLDVFLASFPYKNFRISSKLCLHYIALEFY